MKKVSVFLAVFVTFFSLKGQPCDIRMYDIYSPIGSAVVTFLMCEAHTVNREFFDLCYSATYPNAEMIILYDNLGSTRKFNCHGYAWLRVEKGIDRWIGTGWTNDINEPEWVYVTDGSYYIVSQETYPGKVFWPNDDHTAITTEQSGWFISKWNQYPLFRHRWDDSPYGADFHYYVVNCSVTNNQIVNIIDKTITSGIDIISCGSVNAQNFTITNNATVNITAGEMVWLKPGFHAADGTNVSISINNNSPKSASTTQNSVIETKNETHKISKENDNHAVFLNKPEIKLFPNPNSGSFQLETNFSLSNITHFKITNLLGISIFETQHLDSKDIKLQDVSMGFYFIVATLKDGNVLTQKLMIQR